MGYKEVRIAENCSVRKTGPEAGGLGGAGPSDLPTLSRGRDLTLESCRNSPLSSPCGSLKQVARES